MNRIRLFAAVALAFGMYGPAAAAQEAGAPFSDLQGMWYDMRHKVTVEVIGREVFVREIDTQDITINRHNWTKGAIIARYSGATQSGETYSLAGDCWEFGTEKLVSTCLDSASHYNRPGTKPFWSLRTAGLTLWRRDHFKEADWAARD